MQYNVGEVRKGVGVKLQDMKINNKDIYIKYINL